MLCSELRFLLRLCWRSGGVFLLGVFFFFFFFKFPFHPQQKMLLYVSLPWEGCDRSHIVRLSLLEQRDRKQWIQNKTRNWNYNNRIFPSPLIRCVEVGLELMGFSKSVYRVGDGVCMTEGGVTWEYTGNFMEEAWEWGTHPCKTVLEGLRCVKRRMMLSAERVGCLLTAKDAPATPPTPTPPPQGLTWGACPVAASAPAAPPKG